MLTMLAATVLGTTLLLAQPGCGGCERTPANHRELLRWERFFSQWLSHSRSCPPESRGRDRCSSTAKEFSLRQPS